MRRATGGHDASGDIDFVFENNLESGRLPHDDEIEFFAGRKGFGAVLPSLLTHQSGEPDFIREMRKDVAAFSKRPEHGGHRTFCVTGPARVDFAVADVATERVDGHASHAHRVRVRSKKQARFHARRGKTGHDIGAPRRNFV